MADTKLDSPPSDTFPKPKELQEAIQYAGTTNHLEQIRARRRENPLIGACELGDLAYLILLGIALSPQPSALSVISFIAERARDLPDEPNIYGTIKRLLVQKMIVKKGSMKSPVGGPPIKKLAITPVGLRALDEKERRIRALYEVVTTTHRKPQVVAAR